MLHSRVPRSAIWAQDLPRRRAWADPQGEGMTSTEPGSVAAPADDHAAAGWDAARAVLVVDDEP